MLPALRLPGTARAGLAIGCLVLLGQGAATAAALCYVNDPTGTPLNVRAVPPRGEIVATLRNGQPVITSSEGRDAGGNIWVYIRNGEDDRPLGWVFRRYLACP